MAGTGTIHIIAQAHIDPVWLWPWQAGLDEVLGTCRSACDLLDAHDELIFTAAEAWRYQQIELTDAALFRRIGKHVETGRWQIVGGWWLQPDCNFPEDFSFERQIELGKRYLMSRFGFFPEVAYNVDTFGHSASLPGLLRAHGQTRYVMMRPQEYEKSLPARLFRWQGEKDGPEVLAFRIAGSYGTGRGIHLEHVRKALTELPEGIANTMCFVGVGDHGGGPTTEMIEWVGSHRDAIDGWRLVFSSPGRFFDEVLKQAEALPVVVGELQHHAVGCYSVDRPTKVRIRRAEHRLRQAEIMGAPDGDVESAWQHVCFSQFHDVLGGTCIPSAYQQIHDQLGGASARADEFLQYALRRKMTELCDCPDQRIVLCNASDAPFTGYVEHEPWTQWRGWPEGWQLSDERGHPVPFQLTAGESVNGSIARLLFPLVLGPRGIAVLSVRRDGLRPAKTRVRSQATRIETDDGVAVSLGTEGTGLGFPGRTIALPRLDLIEDWTDNWSHGVDRYPEGPIVSPTWDAAFVVDSGPLMASLLQRGRLGDTTLSMEWRVYADDPSVELRLRVHWREQRKLLKLVLPVGTGSSRLDGISGGRLLRSNDGKELPLHDWTRCDLGPTALGVVAPDAFAIDATPSRVRFTLLRSPAMTHHVPAHGMAPRAQFADQGVHEFRFRFTVGDAKVEWLDQQALIYHRPLLAADLTRGMAK